VTGIRSNRHSNQIVQVTVVVSWLYLGWRYVNFVDECFTSSALKSSLASAVCVKTAGLNYVHCFGHRESHWMGCSKFAPSH